jgi:hypothetical protein
LIFQQAKVIFIKFALLFVRKLSRPTGSRAYVQKVDMLHPGGNSLLAIWHKYRGGTGFQSWYEKRLFPAWREMGQHREMARKNFAKYARFVTPG